MKLRISWDRPFDQDEIHLMQVHVREDHGPMQLVANEAPAFFQPEGCPARMCQFDYPVRPGLVKLSVILRFGRAGSFSLFTPVTTITLPPEVPPCPTLEILD